MASSSSGEDDFCVSSRTPSHKKGPVYMAKLIKQHTKAGTKLTVNFDSKGNPKGQNGNTWRSFLGVVARSRISITFNDWRRVPDHYKVTLWRDATVIFDGCEPHKKHEMKVAGSIWKNFKSRLAKEYIHGAKANEDPMGEYKYLDKDTWRIFKEQRLSENAMKLRETNRELVKKNVYAHILGRGGYRQLEEKLTTEKIAELFAQGAIEEVHSSITIERHELWKRGRKKKNDELFAQVTAKADVFGDDYDIYLFDEEVTDLLKFQALGNAAAELYICHLHDQMLHWDIKFGFFIPSLMTPSIDKNERLATFVGRLNMPDKDQLFCYFLPYVDHIEWHWMLCVIFPRKHKVLWLDSFTEEKDIRADAKELVDMGLDRYYQGCVPRSTRRVEWKKVLCPRQPPSFFVVIMSFIILRTLSHLYGLIMVLRLKT